MSIFFRGAVLVADAESKNKVLLYAPLILSEAGIEFGPSVGRSVGRLKIVKRNAEQKVGKVVSGTDATGALEDKFSVPDEVECGIELVGRKIAAELPIVPPVRPGKNVSVVESVADQSARALNAEAVVDHFVVEGESGATQFKVGSDSRLSKLRVRGNGGSGTGLKGVRALHRYTEFVDLVAGEGPSVGEIRKVVVKHIGQWIARLLCESNPRRSRAVYLRAPVTAERRGYTVLL